MDLYKKHCVPCEGGALALSDTESSRFLLEINPAWRLTGAPKKLTRTFEFKNFVEAMAFVDKLADLAESEGHHPDIHIFYSRVMLELWTHAVRRLSENDFILASKIDQMRMP